MKQFSKLIKSSLVLALAITILGAVPASAEVSSGESSGSGSSSTGETSTAQQAKQKAQQARDAARTAQQQANEAKQNAQSAKAEARAATQNAKTKTAEQKQKICETHKGHANAVLSKVSSGTNNTLTRINTIYARGLEYQTTNSLSPEGIDALIATANSNKDAATNAVTAVQNATPVIDCTSGKVSEQISAYRTAAKDARTQLKAYRTSVKAVLNALAVPNQVRQGGSN